MIIKFLSLILFISLNASAQQSNSINNFNDMKLTSLPNASGGVIVGTNAKGEPVYYAMVNNKFQVVPNSFISSSLYSSFQSAKDYVCSLSEKARPNSVTVSIGILSATWETSKINCKD
jgi:hypothetical protein